jgi:hypothetical protein
VGSKRSELLSTFLAAYPFRSAALDELQFRRGRRDAAREHLPSFVHGDEVDAYTKLRMGKGHSPAVPLRLQIR